MTDAAFWNKAAEKYARDPISDMDGYTTTLGRMRTHLQPHHHVLEIGCGTGSTALELSPGVARYLGTDLSEEMIRIARGKLTPDTPGDLSFEVARAGELPADDLDAVLALNLLHLVPELESVLRNIHDKLPTGGLFIAKTGMLRDGKWFLRPMIRVMQLLGRAPFVRSLSAEEFRRMLDAAGFDLIEEIVQPGMAPRMFTVARKR